MYAFDHFRFLADNCARSIALVPTVHHTLSRFMSEDTPRKPAERMIIFTVTWQILTGKMYRSDVSDVANRVDEADARLTYG